MRPEHRPIFEFHSYQEFLKELAYGPGAAWGVQSRLAKAMGCQAAYLSQVLKGKAELTEDHGLRLGSFLRFSPEEKEHLLLLIRLSRAATPDLRQYLEGMREVGVAESKRLSRKTNVKDVAIQNELLDRYYSDLYLMATHIALSTEDLRSAGAIAKRLRLSQSAVEENLRFLAKHGMAEQKNGAWNYCGQSHYLSKAQQSSRVWTTAQVNIRLRLVRTLLDSDPDNFQFSLIFSTNPKAYGKLKEEATDYIKKVWERIRPEEASEIYVLSLDLTKF